MTEYFSPAAHKVKLPSGRLLNLRRGLQTLPDEFADSRLANDYGIKTQDEMTDADWRSIGMRRPVKVVDPALEDAPKLPAPEKA